MTGWLKRQDSNLQLYWVKASCLSLLGYTSSRPFLQVTLEFYRVVYVTAHFNGLRRFPVYSVQQLFRRIQSISLRRSRVAQDVDYRLRCRRYGFYQRVARCIQVYVLRLFRHLCRFVCRRFCNRIYNRRCGMHCQFPRCFVRC